MPWFKKEKGPIATPKEEERTVHTEGLFRKCDNCNAFIWKRDLEANDKVCPKCAFHFKVGAHERLRMLFDDGQYETFADNILSPDPLRFIDQKPYSDRLR